MGWIKRSWLLLILIIVFLFLQYKLWLSGDGMKHIHVLKKELNTKQEGLTAAKQRNQQLFEQVKHIKNSSEEIEAHARYDLGMIKSGEEYLQVVTPNQQEKKS